MKTLVFLTLIATQTFLAGADSGCANDITSRSPTLRLRRHLFCDYDRYVRPSIHHDNKTGISLRFMPKFIEFDDRSSTLTLHSWVAIVWTDEHLKWNREDFEGIQTIHASSEELWVPDIAIYNSGDMGLDQSGIPRTDCILTDDGMVLCVPAVRYITHCVADYTDWPFDKQNCTVRIGSWAHTGEEIDYAFIGEGVDMRDYIKNREWDVASVNATKHVQKFKCCPSDTFPSVFVHFILERHSTAMRATVITPAIVLIIITLTVLWLDPSSSGTLGLAGINFISHLLSVQSLYWQLPFNGVDCPYILIFYRNSLVISGVAISLTAFLRELKKTTLMAPSWISSSTSFMLESRAGQFLLLTTLDPKVSASLKAEEDNVGLVQSSPSVQIITKNSDAWHLIATLIGRLSFFLVLLTYGIMLATLLPSYDSSIVKILSHV